MHRAKARHVVGLVVFFLVGTAGTARAADVDPYLPDGSEMVLAINVHQLFDSALVQKHFAEALPKYLETEPHWREVRKALPIDLANDVTSLVLAGPAPPREGKGLAILRGKFDVAKLQAAAEAYAAKQPGALAIHKSGVRRVYQFKNSAAPVFAAFLDEGTLALAPARDALEEAIARKDGQKQASVNRDLQALIADADGRQTVWLAALATPELKREFGTPQTEKLFASLVHLKGGLTLGDGMQLDFAIQTRDAKTSGEIRQFMEGIKSILSLAAMDSKENAPLLTKLVGAIKIASVQDAVTIKGSVSKAEIEKTLAERAKP
jgi:hypothetical protein